MEVADVLLGHGLIDHQQRDFLRQMSENGNGTLTATTQHPLEAAVSQGFVKEPDALKAVGQELGMDYLDLRDAEVDLELLKTFPQKLIYRESIFPIGMSHGCLVVATSDPFDLYPLDEVSAVTGLPVTPVLAEKAEIAKLIKRHMGVASETIEGLVAAQEDEGVELLSDIEMDGSELSEMAQEASVVRLVNEILLEAIDLRASDIHIESQRTGLTIRYRVDGMLHVQPVPPEIKRFEAAIVSRLKIMSRLNIAEKRLPQDGRMKLKVQGREVDLRVSVIPMIHGESLVMRILDKGSMVFDLQKIGMDPENYKVYRKLIDLPHGIILVTGPTGSGKTTTLYSSLIEINQPDVKIITTEDPVEYQLEGINQIQVHPKIGLTFAASLRSILRHDPDIVLVGEIRDLETAENAIQASLTGHLVFSTLHTNDAAGAFTRMIDMGVEPFLVASTVEAVMAQRLVRKLCPTCKVPHVLKPEDVPEDFPMELLEGREVFKAVGCRECRNVGYRGRMGIYELLVTGNEVRQLAHDRESSWKIKQAAVRNGMKTLRHDGFLKVLSGQTSIEEVVRTAKADPSEASAG